MTDPNYYAKKYRQPIRAALNDRSELGDGAVFIDMVDMTSRLLPENAIKDIRGNSLMTAIADKYSRKSPDEFVLVLYDGVLYVVSTHKLSLIFPEKRKPKGDHAEIRAKKCK